MNARVLTVTDLLQEAEQIQQAANHLRQFPTLVDQSVVDSLFKSLNEISLLLLRQYQQSITIAIEAATSVFAEDKFAQLRISKNGNGRGITLPLDILTGLDPEFTRALLSELPEYGHGFNYAITWRNLGIVGTVENNGLCLCGHRLCDHPTVKWERRTHYNIGSRQYPQAAEHQQIFKIPSCLRCDCNNFAPNNT